MKRNTDREGAAKTPGQATHTPEPWRRHDMEPDAIVGPDRKAIALVYGRSRNENIDDANLLRIVACVNALEGIANPAAVKQLVEAAGSIVLAIYEDRELGELNAKLDDALEALYAPVPQTTTEEDIS